MVSRNNLSLFGLGGLLSTLDQNVIPFYVISRGVVGARGLDIIHTVIAMCIILYIYMYVIVYVYMSLCVRISFCLTHC